jgi:hypothetical protein
MTREEMLRQMIEDYHKKIVTYQSMIREWESELGLNGTKVHGAESYAAPLDKKKHGAGEPVALVREYQFFGKSQPEAAKMFLEMVGHPLRTSEIIEGIEKGGVKVGGKTPKDKKTNFYTILYRGEDFGLAGKDAWGLTSWPGVKKEKEGKDENSKEEKKA